MKKVLIILLLVTSFASLSQNTAEYKVDEWFKRAEKEIHQNPYKALVYIDSAKIISKSAKFYSRLAKIYDFEGGILKNLNRISKYKYSCYEGLKVAQILKDSLIIYKFKVKIAKLAEEPEAVAAAKESLKTAISFGKRHNHYSILGDAYNVKGNLSLYEEKYKTAKFAYLEAQSYYLKAKDTVQANKINTNLGITAFNLNNFAESKAYFKAALSQSTRSKDIAIMQGDLANLGQYFFEINLLDSANYYAQRSYDLCKLNNLKAPSLGPLGLLVDIHEKKGILSKALHFQKELTHTQNDVLQNDLSLAGLELERLFKKAESAEEIDYVQGLLQDVERKNASLIRLLIVCGIFFILIILIVYFAYRQQNNLNRALLEQRTAIFQKNELIDVALKEKEILLKEIHHRVKNNLQIISSLLNLQSRTITDEKALRALSEGRTRIQAIALLHQKLYQNETFSTVSLEDYILDLTTNLRHSLISSDKSVEININAKEVVLNLDTAVPLGLIISELVTNSLKHAFTNKERGTITINIERDKALGYMLEICDDGKGLPEEFTIPMEGSLGIEIVEALSEQLEGELSFQRNNPGAYFQLLFEEVSVD